MIRKSANAACMAAVRLVSMLAGCHPHRRARAYGQRRTDLEGGASKHTTRATSDDKENHDPVPSGLPASLKVRSWKRRGWFTQVKFHDVHLCKQRSQSDSSFGGYTPAALEYRYCRPRAWITSDAAVGKKLAEELGQAN